MWIGPFVSLLAGPAWALDRLVLSDGQSLYGAVSEADGRWQLILEDDTVLAFPPEAVRRAEYGVERPSPTAAGTGRAGPSWPGGRSTWPEDPDGDRYFLMPTGRNTGKGHGVFSQREAAGSVIEYNLTDNLQVSGGAVVPLLFADYLHLATLGVRLTSPAGEHFDVGVGLQGFVVFESLWVAPHGVVSWHDDRHSLSLGGGATVSDDDWTVALASVSGGLRVGPRAWLYSETWFLSGGPLSGGLVVAPSFAGRLITRRVSFDVGLVVVTKPEVGATPVPMPLFNVAWHFPEAAF
jgi:hypothetical protein